jgi:hypothetical protein
MPVIKWNLDDTGLTEYTRIKKFAELGMLGY